MIWSVTRALIHTICLSVVGLETLPRTESQICADMPMNCIVTAKVSLHWQLLNSDHKENSKHAFILNLIKGRTIKAVFFADLC